jgi:glycosyltransferase involved in cell wall biosynthesis
MRIAQVAPLYESVPPRLYGGTERVISYLTEELVGLGHDVTLFASGDAQTTARLIPACPVALWHDPDVRETLPHHVRLVEMVLRDASQFDAIHFHCDYVHFPAVRRQRLPTVTTMHGSIHAHDLAALLHEYGDVPLVSISNDQRRPVPDANWQATVYHGLPRTLFAYRERSEGYVAFLGRMSPEKGVVRAIEIARRCGVPLKIAAKIYPEEQLYFDRIIAPLLDTSRPLVDYLGEVGDREKEQLLAGARALLFPIDWPEPFGLVMIEAMACGTPVIGWRRGSVPEVLEEGVTGFIVDTVDEAVRAVGRIDEIDRGRCRRVFEERFDAGSMARNYLEVYRPCGTSARTHSAHDAGAVSGSTTATGRPQGAAILDQNGASVPNWMM